MIALDGRIPLSFTYGLLAAVNPCGFVLLPTYLLYFLGMENLRPGADLLAGYIAVFRLGVWGVFIGKT